MRVVVITPPDPVVSLDEAKAHLNVDSDDDDALITGLIAAATAHLDGPAGWLGRSLGRQELKLSLSAFGCDRFVSLPCPPLVANEDVVVSYRDREGEVHTFSAFSVVGNLVWLNPTASWPVTGPYSDAVSIVYQAGYDALPAPIRVAILMHVATLYESREISSAESGDHVPNGYEALLSPFRIYS